MTLLWVYKYFVNCLSESRICADDADFVEMRLDLRFARFLALNAKWMRCEACGSAVLVSGFCVILRLLRFFAFFRMCELCEDMSSANLSDIPIRSALGAC